MPKVAQLRTYKVKEGEFDALVQEWKAKVVPLRHKFGFKVEGAWTVRGEDTFVWIVSYDGPEGFEARDAAYYASPERKALRPDPTRHIVHAETRLMVPVPR